jgi:hypothetical protein
MNLSLMLDRGVAFIFTYMWSAVAVGFLAVVITPAIWSRHRDRRRAAMAVIRVFILAVTVVVVARRRSRHQWYDVFTDLLSSEEDLPSQLRPTSPGSVKDPNRPPTVEDVDRGD